MADEAYSEEDDELLLLRIEEDRDAAALILLMKRHSPKMKGHLKSTFSKSLREPEMHQAINSAFEKVWRKPDQFNSTRGSVGGWLIGIVHKEAISIHRAEQPHRAVSLEADPPDPFADDCEDAYSEGGERDLWRLEQVDDIIENVLKGLEQGVARAFSVSGGDPDIGRLARQYQTTKNSVSVTLCKVKKKLRRLVEEREEQKYRPKGKI